MKLRKYLLIYFTIMVIVAGIAVAVIFGTGPDFSSLQTMLPFIFLILVFVGVLVSFLIGLPGKILFTKIMLKGIETTATATRVFNNGSSNVGRGNDRHRRHWGFSVRLTYIDESGKKVNAISRTTYTDRAIADDVVSIKQIRIRYLGRHVEILPEALNEFYKKHPHKRPKRFGLDELEGSHHKSRKQIERERARKKELSKLSKKEREKEHMKEHGVATRSVYWFGIFVAITVVGALGYSISLLVRGYELFGFLAFGGTFVYVILIGLVYLRLKTRQSYNVKRDKMAREFTGVVEEITPTSSTLRGMIWSVRIAVGDKKPIAIYQNSELDRFIRISETGRISFEEDIEGMVDIDGLIAIGKKVRVLFNPQKPNICKIVRVIKDEEEIFPELI
ncbi:MAG: hypothetical protein FWE45_01920 [Firmicutes bacterium]|nr:hypothetical protein [Bacillota bacterium]